MILTMKSAVVNTGKFDVGEAWNRVLARDAGADGRFVYAVKTTGIFCRPSCPSRKPSRANVEFYDGPVEAVRAGFRACQRCRPEGRRADTETVDKLCRYLEENIDRLVTLDELAEQAGASKFTVQRMFVRVLGVSAAEYQRELRARKLKHALNGKASAGKGTSGKSTTNARGAKDVTEAIYEAGYSSPSRAYEGAAARLGMSPGQYRSDGRGMQIRYATVKSALGQLLVAATNKGLCAVTLGDDPAEMEQSLREQFPAAEVTRDESLTRTARQVLAGERAATAELPLDVRATAFQLRVWQALKNIPRGETRSYSQVARAIGQPTAVRAVARACATNPVAVVVPCHRVVGSDGKLTGYRWGVERKKKLLEMEHTN